MPEPSAATGGAAQGLAGADWLTAPHLANLLAALDRDGEEARVIGGAVRNALLGEAIAEVDVATTALPEEVIRRVASAGWKAVPTGIDHGTVTAVVDGRPFEVTTLRIDVETFGRKATVKFGRDWKADAERRDFTMNALSVVADGTLYDYVGGLADLKARRVRFIGDPATRIAEDYLRILRFFRFHAAYGEGAPDAAGLHACIAGRAGLDQLSRERVRMELLKLLAARGAVAALDVMAETGLLVTVLAAVPVIPAFDAMVECEAALGLKPDPIRRLGALAVFISDDADHLRQHLRLANVEHERLAAMGEGWWRVSPEDDHAARALLYRLGPLQFVDRVLMAWAHAGNAAKDASWARLATLPQRWTAPVFPLKAADFIKRGVPTGRALGAALRAAEEAWIASGFPDATDTLDCIARAAIKGV